MSQRRLRMMTLAFAGLLAAMPPLSVAGDVTREALAGTWHAAPEPGQLGEVRISYTFGEDDSFSQTADFLSFCGRGAVTPDCEYFRNISEGTYVLQGSVLRLSHRKAGAHLKYVGKAEPMVRDMGMRPMEEEMQVRIEEGQLVLTNRNGKATVLSPQPSRDQE